MRKEPEQVRFWRYATLSLGCWEWTGTKDSHGYGKLRPSGTRTTTPAHAVAYQIFVGQIRTGYELHHLCENHSCVNPDHLELVTRKEHTVRHDGLVGRWNRAKTHCPKGHPYSGDNLIVYQRTSGPRRHCRECVNQRTREWVARQRAKANS